MSYMTLVTADIDGIIQKGATPPSYHVPDDYQMCKGV